MSLALPDREPATDGAAHRRDRDGVRSARGPFSTSRRPAARCPGGASPRCPRSAAGPGRLLRTRCEIPPGHRSLRTETSRQAPVVCRATADRVSPVVVTFGRASIADGGYCGTKLLGLRPCPDGRGPFVRRERACEPGLSCGRAAARRGTPDREPADRDSPVDVKTHGRDLVLRLLPFGADRPARRADPLLGPS